MPAGVYFAEQVSPAFPAAAIRAHVVGPCRVAVTLERSGPPTAVSIETCPEALVTPSLSAAQESTFRLEGTKKHSVTATFVVEYPFAWHVYKREWSFVQLTAPQITDRRYTASGPPLEPVHQSGQIREVSRVRPPYPEHAAALGAKGLCSVVVHVGPDGVPTAVTRQDCADVFYPNAVAAARNSRFDMTGVPEGAVGVFTFTYSFWTSDISVKRPDHPLASP